MQCKFLDLNPIPIQVRTSYLTGSTLIRARTQVHILVLVNSYTLPFPVLHVREKFDKITIDSLFLISDIEEE